MTAASWNAGRAADRLRRFLRRLDLGESASTRLRSWHRTAPPDLGLAHGRARYVVVDTETSGLDVRHDQVIAIGAVAVTSGWLALSDCLEIVLRQEAPSARDNILVHRIGGQDQLGGVEPADGLLDFLEYVGASPLVAFRADFDRAMLERAARSILGAALRRPWIDLAFLLPALFPGTECASLDEWVAHFGLEAGERHNAVADAFACGQLLQIALAAAERDGMRTAKDLLALQKAQHWLGKRF